MVTIYLFDVDHTLEISGGPVTLQQLVNLKMNGHIIGLNGNWAVFCWRVRGWSSLISMMNIAVDKATFMMQIKTYLQADRYVMIGNDGDGITVSGDKKAAEVAGWEFILEKDFKEGIDNVAQTSEQKIP